MKTLILAATTALLCAIIAALGIGYIAYWSMPAFPIRFEGDPTITYDGEIGFVARPNSATMRTDSPALSYHIYNDRRGARVTKQGEQTPDRVDIVFAGDSFPWGHGVEGHQTFAALTPAMLGLRGANLAMGSYGTVQALQVLRRNLDLRPRVIVYPVITDHLRRNVSACAPAYYPFCLDVSFAWTEGDSTAIRPPRSNGLRRTATQIEHEQRGLSPWRWITHGVDVIYGLVLSRLAAPIALDPARQQSAMRYLIGELAEAARSVNARLVVAFVPMAGMEAPPDVVISSAREVGATFVDLSPALKGAGDLYLPDGHPNVQGHQAIAQEIARSLKPMSVSRQ